MPITHFTVYFVFGVYWAQQMPCLPSAKQILSILIGISLIYLWLRHNKLHTINLAKLKPPIHAIQSLITRNTHHLSHSILIILIIGLGFFWAIFRANIRLAEELPKIWESYPIEIVGVVSSLPQKLENGLRFEFKVEKVESKEAIVPKHISLSYYSKGSHTQLSPIHAGERWHFLVKLKRPHSTLNEHGFDLEKWALEKNIRAMGTIKESQSNRRIQAFVPGFFHDIERLREKIRTRMEKILITETKNPCLSSENNSKKSNNCFSETGVLTALAIGDESNISVNTWDLFNQTGIIHLMSISGLHITMLSGLVISLFMIIFSRISIISTRFSVKKIALLTGLLTAWGYALIAGWGIPSQRTVWMLTACILTLWMGKNLNAFQILAIALLAVIVIDPFAITSTGFILSFLAVAIILLAFYNRLSSLSDIKAFLTTQWVVTIGLLPALIFLFQQVSIISPIANLIAIPVVSLFIVPSALVGSFFAIDFFLYLAKFLTHQLFIVMDYLSKLPFPSIWIQHTPSFLALAIAIISIIVLLLPRGFPLKNMAWIGIISLFLMPPRSLDADELKISILDVGQGLSILVRTTQHTLIYDTGPHYTEISDSGRRIIMPYLRGEGIKKIDKLVLSHNDSDHTGGANYVLQNIRVDQVMSSILQESEQQKLGIQEKQHKVCQAGQSWNWENMQFEILSPNQDELNNPEIKDNNLSCVLKITHPQGKNILITGDIEELAETDLLKTQKPHLQSTVMIVPHHGSKTSSQTSFIQAVSPKIAIITNGYHNHFGHPKAEVIERYQKQKIKIYRTDLMGEIQLSFQNDLLTISNYRQKHKRYWY